MDWLDLLAVQGTLKSFLQHHSSKASILQCSAFFMVQLSYPYMTTGKTITLTRWTFAGKVMSLLFNMLSKLIITFLPRGKHLLISWLQLPSVVILEPKKIKSVTVSPSICLTVFFIYFCIALQYASICSDFALCQNFQFQRRTLNIWKLILWSPIWLAFQHLLWASNTLKWRSMKIYWFFFFFFWCSIYKPIPLGHKKSWVTLSLLK